MYDVRFRLGVLPFCQRVRTPGKAIQVAEHVAELGKTAVVTGPDGRTQSLQELRSAEEAPESGVSALDMLRAVRRPLRA